jgi:hypothetical protein
VRKGGPRCSLGDRRFAFVQRRGFVDCSSQAGGSTIKTAPPVPQGTASLYAEMARPLAERQIVPMINIPDVDDEAIAVYREWLAKPDRVQY